MRTRLAAAIMLALVSVGNAQSLPSPEVSKDAAGIVIQDYLLSLNVTKFGALLHECSHPTNVVIVALPIGVAVPTWSALFSATNIAAAKQRRAALSGETNQWTRDQRFNFEIHFDMENRMRAQESKAAITKQQYFNALNAVWTNTP